MNVHKNARLTPRGRERIVRQVESGQTPEAVAEAAGVCPRTVRKWIDRYRREGLAGLQDRSSRPHRLRQPTPQPVVDEIERLRRQRWTGKEIAAETGVSPATVSRVLRRLGLNKLSSLEPAEPIRRYERQKPGELIHLDIKKLGRIGSVVHRITGRYPGVVNRHHGIGWEFVHVAYARAYHSSDQRSADLSNWLHRYNWHRPHGSLKANTPISRLGLSEDNLLRLHN
jgi:transposase